jgi:hypothetical protein
MTTVIELQPTATAATRELSHEPAHDLAPDLRAVSTHQTLAVVCALMCIGTPAIAAVIYAGHVRTRLALGDLEGARRASRAALWLCCTSVLMSMSYVLVIALNAKGYSQVH